MFVCTWLLWFSAAVAGQAAEPAGWSLAEHFDRLLVYDSNHLQEFAYGDREIRAPAGGMVRRVAGELPDGKLKPLLRGIEVGGELRPGQLLLTGQSALIATVVEFVVEGGREIQIEYGLADHAHAQKNSGTRLAVELHAGGKIARQIISITANRWAVEKIALPQAERVLVRLGATRRGRESVNWSCVVVRGDGRLGTRDQARKLSQNSERIGKVDLSLPPSPHRSGRSAGSRAGHISECMRPAGSPTSGCSCDPAPTRLFSWPGST